MSGFDEKYNSYLKMINSAASAYVSFEYFAERGSSGLSRMTEAMSYSLENGGKRIRPVLTLEFCRLCGGDPEKALPYALAIEMIHTYSLIHDDLPCMDDDDMRRGKPSNHKVFGYADALLAGDALLTFAFEVLLSASDDPAKLAKAGAVLARAAGCSGMIAGQVMDLQNEGVSAPLETVTKTDKLKTGEMISAAAVLGCIAAGGSDEKIAAAEGYARNIGLAFQIVDDILDVTGDEAALGKPIGSDGENGKSTYVSLLGLEKSGELANELDEKAKAYLSVFGDEAGFLKELADRLSSRRS